MVYYYFLSSASTQHPAPELPFPYPPEQPHPSLDPRHSTTNPFAPTEWLASEHLLGPHWQIPPGIPEAYPPVAAITDGLIVRDAALPVDHTFSESILHPEVPSAPASGSNPHNSVMDDGMRHAAPGTRTPGPSTLVVLGEEITHPPKRPASVSCDFGGALTLGDALKKDFSQMPGDGARRAFPTEPYAAKMAFWYLFNCELESTFRPRRKQVTVVTTRRSVIEQPSMARLAYLVAREMKKYLEECNLRKQPFPYTLDDIVLRRIDVESRGTLRPRLFARSVHSISLAATW